MGKEERAEAFVYFGHMSSYFLLDENGIEFLPNIWLMGEHVSFSNTGSLILHIA